MYGSLFCPRPRPRLTFRPPHRPPASPPPPHPLIVRPSHRPPVSPSARFTVRPLRAWGFSRVTLSARFESRGNETLPCSLAWSGLEGERDCFSGTLETGEYVGLIWYTIRMEGLDGRWAEEGDAGAPV